jgi:hypothetical protein
MTNAMTTITNSFVKLVEADAPSSGNSTVHEDFVDFKQSINARIATLEDDVKGLHQSMNSGFASILQAIQGGRGQNDTSQGN